MTDKNTGIAKIRESLGETASGQSDSSVMQTWLNTLIESVIQHPERPALAPFQEYFVDQRPFDDQLSNFLTREFFSLIPGADKTRMITLRSVIADQLSAPEAFTTRHGHQLVLSDIYQSLFNWFTNTDIMSAIDIAQKIVQSPKLAKIALPDSQPLALSLFKTINAQLTTKDYGCSFYQAVFQFALETPNAVAADIPEIMEANIHALGDDNDMLRQLLSEYPVLKTAYRDYLSNHYPESLEKYENRLATRIRAALPREFSDCLETPDTLSR